MALELGLCPLQSVFVPFQCLCSFLPYAAGVTPSRNVFWFTLALPGFTGPMMACQLPGSEAGLQKESGSPLAWLTSS